jgi:hypothetical protein
MTAFRYEGGKPVGLDWSVHNDGSHDPTLWRKASRISKDAEAKAARKRARPGVQNPGVGRGGARKHPAEVEQAVIEAYRAGRPIPDITNAYPMSNKTVYRILDRNGVPRRNDR